MRDVRFRSCPLCEAICGLELHYDDDSLIAIRGDRNDPFSRGHICPKGNAILDLEADPDRVGSPLLRRGDDFVPLPWDEALDLAGERIASIQREHGPAALGIYLGNPNVHHFGHVAYLPQLLRTLRTPNVFSASSVDQWPHQLVAAQMYGHPFLLPIPDIDRTDLMLMLGANPLASNGSLMTAPGIAARLAALVARGALIVVDPRRSETAAMATEHLAILPGTDACFLVALLQAIVRRGPPRVARYADRLVGLEQALLAVSSFDAALCARACGIDPERIEAVAARLHAARRAAIYGRMGVSTQRFGSLCQWLIQLLNLVLGQLDQEGGVLPNDAVVPMTGPGSASGRRARWLSRVRGLAEFMGELPVAALCEEIVTPGPDRIRALLTCAGNPVASTPDGAALDRALPTLDFMLAVDIYVNETTRHADLILPPASPLSQPHYDLIFNALAVRRVARWSPALRPQRPEERADWQILQGIAAAWSRAMGRDYAWLPPPEPLLRALLDAGGSGLDFETLAAAPHGIDLGPLRPNLFARLQTPDARVHCAPTLLLDDLPRLGTAMQDGQVPPSELLLVGRRDVRSNNSWMHNAPRLVKGRPRHALHMHPTDLSARGLLDGQRVEVSSRRGRIEVEVRACTDLRPGVVSLPHGYGQARPGVRLARAATLDGASYNDLTDPLDLDVPSGNAVFNGVPVRVTSPSDRD